MLQRIQSTRNRCWEIGAVALLQTERMRALPRALNVSRVRGLKTACSFMVSVSGAGSNSRRRWFPEARVLSDGASFHSPSPSILPSGDAKRWKNRREVFVRVNSAVKGTPEERGFGTRDMLGISVMKARCATPTRRVPDANAETPPDYRILG